MAPKPISQHELMRFHDIADRAEIMAVKYGREDISRPQIICTIVLAHMKVPLKLDALFMADDANFAHDVFGILRHFDVPSGKMRDCFLPRYAKLNDKEEV